MVTSFNPSRIIDINGKQQFFEKYMFFSSNASIIKVENKYLVCIRYLNYFLKKNGNTYVQIKNGTNENLSINKIVELSDNLDIVDNGKYIIPNNDIKKNLNTKEVFISLEDIRLYNYNGNIKIIGAVKDNKRIKVVVGDYNINNNKFFNLTILNPIFNFQSIEKNWVYFTNFKNELKIIYSWYPLRICSSKGNLLFVTREVKMPDFFKNARGSTCGVIYKDEIWFICHFGNNLNYTHFFAIFDEMMNLKRYSSPFKFQNAQIEFAAGLEISDKEILISYSIFDNNTRIGIYKHNDLEKLTWISSS